MDVIEEAQKILEDKEKLRMAFIEEMVKAMEVSPIIAVITFSKDEFIKVDSFGAFDDYEVERLLAHGIVYQVLKEG